MAEQNQPEDTGPLELETPVVQRKFQPSNISQLKPHVPAGTAMSEELRQQLTRIERGINVLIKHFNIT